MNWLPEDIINKINTYGDDYRVHFVELTEENAKDIEYACKNKGIKFQEITQYVPFSEIKPPSKQHLVLGVGVPYSIAQNIPKDWKIGLIYSTQLKRI